MPEEIEVKYLDVDIVTMEETLQKVGAVKKFDRIYRRMVYDYPDLRLNAVHAWVRVRDEGDQVTLTFKQRIDPGSDGANDGGMEEVEMVVSDFLTAAHFLEKIGMKRKFYEENRRIRYLLGDIEFDIDHWPLLNPYLEIEGGRYEDLDEAARLVGLDPKDRVVCSAYQIYARSGIDEYEYDELTFERQVKKVL